MYMFAMLALCYTMWHNTVHLVIMMLPQKRIQLFANFGSMTLNKFVLYEAISVRCCGRDNMHRMLETECIFLYEIKITHLCSTCASIPVHVFKRM